MEDPQKNQKNWTVEIKWVLKYLRWCKIFNYPHFCYGMGAWKSLEIKKLIDFLTNESINQLEEKIGWFKIFSSLYQVKDVTTYMHALYFHVPEFLKLCKIVAYFN